MDSGYEVETDLIPANQTCDYCTRDDNSLCTVEFPSICGNDASWFNTPYCESADPDQDWSGVYQVDMGSGECLFNGLLGGCGVTCDTTQCSCFQDSVNITQDPMDSNNLWIEATIIPVGTTDPIAVMNWFTKNGNSGLSSTGNLSIIVWDITKLGGDLTFKDRPKYGCVQTAALNSPSASIWKVALLAAAGGVVVLGICIYCFWSRRKKQQKQQQENNKAGKPDSAPYSVLPSEDRRRGLN